MEMRDEKDKKEQPDGFSDYMRQRLEGHRLPVEDSCWEEVEARMKRKPRPGGWWWIGSLVAAAILALVVWLLPVPDDLPMEETILSEKIDTEKRALPSTEADDLPEKTNASTVKATLVRQQIAKIELPGRTTLEAIPEVKIEDDPEVEIVAVPVVSKRVGATVPKPEEDQMYKMGKSGKEKVKGKAREQNKWLLAASVGTSGYSARPLGDMPDNWYDNAPPADKPNDGNDDDKNDESGNPVPGVIQSMLPNSSPRRFTDELSPFDHSFESYPEVSYSLPVSFGFTVRKSLSKRVGIESGLIYTYLSTTFRQTGSYRTEVRSKLHYLGIPVNLVVNLWDHSKWNIYLSGGGMVEKGVQAVYNQRKARMEKVDSRTVKEGISGLQWSMNLSVGAAYRVYRDWSLYLEPRFSYYFESDQPVSIRTDKPLGFGLNAGVRFEF